MKIRKPSKFEVIIVIWIILPIISLFISDVFFHDTMTGAEGLENIILSIIFRTITGILFAVPLIITGIKIFRIDYQEKLKFVSFGMLFLTIVVPLILFVKITNSHFDEHHYIRKQNDIFADYSTLLQCVSDLSNDDYEKFTINSSYINQHKHLSSSGRGGSSYHYEYTVAFYNNNQKIIESQISADDADYIRSLPAGFDTEVTVYSKSGFIRSIEPSVDFRGTESYEHYFTLSMDGDNIVYERNISQNIKIENLTWSGFMKNQSHDIHNSVFGINAEKNNIFDKGFVTCNEICLYGIVDGQYRRISNIIVDNKP